MGLASNAGVSANPKSCRLLAAVAWNNRAPVIRIQVQDGSAALSGSSDGSAATAMVLLPGRGCRLDDRRTQDFGALSANLG
jgi:hypothetical protein